MTADRWQRLEALFHAALDHGTADRAAFLSGACDGDAELQVELERLLEGHAQASAFVGNAMAGIEHVAAALPADGSQIGAYRIVRELGRGGMGTVYLGERCDAQFDMRVAIKLIKRGMDSDAVLQRFRHERQILAGLDHPNIARLLDGGTTSDGLPYFVMEHVDGVPIDEYCRARQLSLDQCLRLFQEVCAAVSYAHQHLVVHRDLKPSNILVTADGVPKLLDFGIAKLLDQGEGPSTQATVFGLQAMTPQYASPEQLHDEQITTVSDVYALGVLLYELLTGARPYDVTAKSPEDTRRIVTGTEVMKPSAMAARRGDGVLLRRLRGDLDAIVITAMRRDPAERYGSVALFAEDLRRHAEGLPVTARGDSWTYRTARFVRRRKLAVAAAAAIVLSLIGGVIATSWQARLARAERARAERRFNDVRKLANAVLFDYHDAIQALPGATAVRERLVTDGLAYLDSLAAEAKDEPALQRELAGAYDRMGTVLGKPYAASLGNPEAALESYQKALRIREALVAADPRDPQNRRELAESHRQIGWLLLDSTRTGGGSDHLRQAISIYAQLAAEHSGDPDILIGLARAHNELGSILEDRGDFSGALENERRALALLEALTAAAPGHSDLRRTLSITHDYIARSLFLSGDVAGALASNAKALELRLELSAEDPTNATLRRMVAIGYQNDGDFRNLTGDPSGALTSFRRKLVIDEELVAVDPANVVAHADLGYSLQRLGDILAAQGLHADALPHYRRSAGAYQQSMRRPDGSTTHLRLAVSHAAVARSEASLGNRGAALEAIRRADRSATDAPDDPENAHQRGIRAEAYQYMAETNVALATRRGTGAAESRTYWRAACHEFRRTQDVWEDMRRRGILSAPDAGKPGEVAREIARCEQMVAKSTRPEPGRRAATR